MNKAMACLILNSVSQSLTRGRLLLPRAGGCCFKCCARFNTTRAHPHQRVLGTRRSSQHAPNHTKLSMHPVSSHGFSLHSSFFKSKYLLLPVSTTCCVSQTPPSSPFHLVHLARLLDPCVQFSNCTAARSLHTTAALYKEESKVEQAIKALKEKVAHVKEDKDGVSSVLKEPKVVRHETEPPVTVPAKKTLWQRFVAELKHYYHGFKLLFIDIRICTRLLWNVLNGKSLTRRERRQLVRTTADMFRLVPFLVFLLVPFMEFLLPVAVKLFPNMLPSTFAEENKEQEKLKKQLKLKMEMAKFLQETIHETSLQKKKKTDSAVMEFSEFVEKIRSQGIQPTTTEIIKFAKLFEDEITLDNLSRQQLRAVCRVLNIQPIGIDALLRFQLDIKLRQLKADDRMIVKEGLDAMSMMELQAANRARGMRALGVSQDRLRTQLQQWLTLHLEERIPTSLLLLSRALYLPETLSTEEQLKATITTLTETAPAATEEAKLKAAELAGEEVDNKTRLDIIKKEEDIIAAETKARQEEELAEQEEKARVVQHEREAAEALAGKAAMESREPREEELILEPAKSEVLVDKAPELKGTADEELKAHKELEEMATVEEEHITAQELEDIETALEEIAEQKQLNIEKEELQDLKQEVNEYKEDLQDLKQVMVLSGKEQDTLVESKAAKRLIKRVDRLIRQADSVMVELQADKERFQEEIEVGEVRLKRSAELKADEKKVEEVKQRISQSKDNIVSINEMLLAMRRLKKVPSDTKLQRIVEVLDEDQDGIININLALKVIEVLGQENVKLNKAQVTEMLNLLKAEMELEEEEKLKKHEKEKEEQLRQTEVQN
ncbi:mitochondrial proton/calcium exchanger protein-like [Babylonia areolata]|uniref:mitochondrial proton/calcium exchanger protein-like n=1 Tax=Babylonia areolata TaxID=304850 RepID=UPI003FD18B0C